MGNQKKKIAGFVYNWLRHIDFVGFWIFRHLKKISNCFHRCKWCSYSSDDTFLPYIIKWKAQASGFKATYGLKINTTSNSFYIELLPFHQCLQLPCLLSQPLTTHPRLPNQLTFTATTKVLKPSCPRLASSPSSSPFPKTQTSRPNKRFLLNTQDLAIRVIFDSKMGKFGSKWSLAQGCAAIECNKEWCWWRWQRKLIVHLGHCPQESIYMWLSLSKRERERERERLAVSAPK